MLNGHYPGLVNPLRKHNKPNSASIGQEVATYQATSLSNVVGQQLGRLKTDRSRQHLVLIKLEVSLSLRSTRKSWKQRLESTQVQVGMTQGNISAAWPLTCRWKSHKVTEDKPGRSQLQQNWAWLLADNKDSLPIIGWNVAMNLLTI